MDDKPLPLPAYSNPHFVVEDSSPLDILFDAEGYPVIPFAPVAQQRRRRIGWDEVRQRAFVALLARVPSVVRAARAVGMSARSAYKLLDRPGAEGFARAWDLALEHGLTRLRGQALARCLEGGDFVRVYRKGKMVRIEHRPNDRLALALLGGQHRDVSLYRHGAQRRWRQVREWASLDAEKAAAIEAEARAREEAARASEVYARELEELLERGRVRRRGGGPRVTFL